ncbi:hypothetical protein BCR42DRAFT_437969 [Absidia repens]|uniref:RRM Nup35-type domain-containing protein n=1 Tax=Absidia repens TaxID=90262 RepID=A0A1X2IFZ4_9FUNG|nr:hypothetical protein BCR42DRAFT_437969 [Absidia repens]
MHRPYDTLNTGPTLNQPQHQLHERTTWSCIISFHQHILGFPSNMRPLVLQHIAKYGQIIDNNSSQWNENRMILRYSTVDEARKAIAGNVLDLIQHCAEANKNINHGLSSSIPSTQDMSSFAQKAVNGILGKLRRIFL